MDVRQMLAPEYPLIRDDFDFFSNSDEAELMRISDDPRIVPTQVLTERSSYKSRQRAGGS